jgi:hypothetical protein
LSGDAAPEAVHGAVDCGRPLFPDRSDQRRGSVGDVAGDPLQDAVGLFGVVGVVKAAGEQADRPAEEDADRAPEDPDEQSDEASGEGPDVRV